MKDTLLVDGHQVTISNPNKVLWPELGITKADYLTVLTKVAPYLIRYCERRYLTVIRYPDGVEGKSFYQKNAPHPFPSFVETAELNGIRYVNLNNLATLMWLGNLACVEFHPSFEYIGTDTPAEWMIDLDPSQEQEPRIMEAAAAVGDVLASLQIEAVPKTSGATGVQIVVPIKPGYTFKQLRSIGHFIAQYLVDTKPHLFTIERYKRNRAGKIYFDYLQHWPGKTLSAPYTPRGNRFGGVSTPLTWDEVRRGVDLRDFHLLAIEQRLIDYGDLISLVAPQDFSSILPYLKQEQHQ